MIKFGMKVPEIFAQLVKGYKKVTGRNPEGLDLIRIRQESLRRFQDMNKVVDMQTGKSIDPSKPIVGGSQEFASGIMKAMKTKPKEVKEVQKRIDSGVASTIEKMLAMEPIDAMKEANKVIGRKGEYKNLSQEDAKKILQDTEDHIFERNVNVDPEDMADGGRIGFKKGMDRRTFMKMVGGLTALPILGKLFKGAEVAAPVAEKAAEIASGAPPYFFDLVNKIKIFGKQRQTPSYKERVNEYTYQGKNGIEYELVEDLDTGEIKITKDKIGGANYGDESYDVIEDRTEMVYKKGQADETTKGTPADEYDEYKVEFDQDGTAADATEIDEVSKMEIIKEVSGDAPAIKKADGGIAMMLGE